MSSNYVHISFNRSNLWILGTEKPEPERRFYYQLKRCKNKMEDHACGETWIQADDRLVSSCLNPLGTSCGLRNDDVILRWAYKNSTPFKQKPDAFESKNEKTEDKTHKAAVALLSLGTSSKKRKL